MEKTWQEACLKKAESIAKLLISKQEDYGKQNILDFGELGILVRSNDKFARLKNLYNKEKPPQNESIRETWEDIAGYAILALMLIDKEFDLPFEEK